MVTKSDILNNLREYTADQIVEAIKAGTVTVYELSKSGNLTPLMRRRIEERLAAKTTETSPSAPEVNPSAEEAHVLNLDEDSSEDIKIPEAVDTDVHSEITIQEAPIITATAAPTFEFPSRSRHLHPTPPLIRECLKDHSLLMVESEELSIACHSLYI